MVEIFRGKNAFEGWFAEVVGGFEEKGIEVEAKCVEHGIVCFVSICERREAEVK